MTSAPGLPPLSHAGRVGRVRDRVVADGGPDTLLVTDPVDVRWCTGFTGSTSWLAVLPGAAVLGTDLRYLDRALAELADAGLAGDVEVVADRTRPDQEARLRSVLSGRHRVGADPASLTHARWTELAADVPLEPVGGCVAAERRCKDDAEVARIAEACRIADEALAIVAPMLRDHPTEVDVRDELEYRMRRLGADGPSYDTIVASGPEHAARPHHGAERRTITEGDLVVIDVGALVDGYHSDMTRTYHVDGGPDGLDAEHRELYELVLDAQLAGLAAVGPGVAAREVDRVCRAVFEAADRGDWYLHGTGHGVGLLIHEDPFLAATATADLVVGDVVTVEPGLYRAGVGGVRIEDLVVVTGTGCRILTQTPKDSPCLPSPPTT